MDQTTPMDAVYAAGLADPVDPVNPVDTITARHIRVRVPTGEANTIISALTSGSTVTDTAGLSKGAVRVADFIAQHAVGGRHAALYPIPRVPGDTERTEPATCDMWQFTYPDGEVHGHIMLHHDISNLVYICAMPMCFPKHGLYGTTSRMPTQAQTRTEALSIRSGFSRYLFGRDNDVVRGWALAQPYDINKAADVDGAYGEHGAGGLRECVPLPGEDLHFDAGPGYLSADYVLHRKRRP